MNCSNLLVHSLGDCLSRYKDLCNKHTCSSLSFTSNPSSCFIKMISSSSPYRNVVLTSICSSSMSTCVTKANINLIDLCFTTGEKILLKSTPSSCINPLATSLALNLTLSLPGASYFFLKIYLQSTTFRLLGLSTSLYVLFLCNDWISSFIVTIHLSLSLLVIALE